MTDWYEEGRIKGIEEGRIKGIEEGITEERIRKSAEDILIAMNKFGCTLEDALETFKVSEQDKPKVLALVEEMQKAS
ncbi:MAG: hypothetical protein J5707_00760 [Candidatus Methanomethylophilus sp.]|nr:hypothetical protein [Methanomethylophilus sp.]